jgi:hypothetical protein
VSPTDHDDRTDHLTYADYERLIAAARVELRAAILLRNADVSAENVNRVRAARANLRALKDDCEDAYGHNPGGW